VHIAGGLYRELCEFPPWDAEYGSGGRAAAAVSAASPGSVLHTYLHSAESPGAVALRGSGIDVRGHVGGEGVVFAYFHSLSFPHIEPSPATISKLPALQVTADVILRFGILEGDAIVFADRAVYDPQTHRGPRPFSENGSSARQLALVLNDLEACSLSGADNSAEAAARIVREQGAAVVVVKRGPCGAEVHRADGRSTWIPPYRSKSVFKIGTGDVFSALFTLHWAERGLPPEGAADLASRAVAAYCETRALPIPEGAGSGMRPIGGPPAGPILLAAASDTLGRRWLAEEARFWLGQLGADVIDIHGLKGTGAGTDRRPAAVLALAEGLREGDWRMAAQANVPMVVFAETSAGRAAAMPGWLGATVTDDFASAAYLALWSALLPELDPPSLTDGRSR
jgi:hypothetical protein